MSSTGEQDKDRNPPEADVYDGSDIYAEDGSVRSDYLMHVGAAIADRDLLYLRQHVARLHASEMGRPARGDPAGPAPGRWFRCSATISTCRP